MPTRSPDPLADNFWDTLDEVLDAPSSPVPRSTLAAAPRHRGQKRSATEAGLPSDNEDDEPSTSSPFTPSPALRHGTTSANRNLVAVARRLGGQKKLRSEQMRELEDFAADSLSAQNIKLFGQMLALENKLDKIIVAQPPFQVMKDSELWINLVAYSQAVFFSSKLAAYKGPTALNHVLDIVKRMRFGIPRGLEHNSASWDKVVHAVQGILTQIRGAVKKEFKKGADLADHKMRPNIFKLTEKLLSKTSCRITIPVMARIALMRTVYYQEPGDDFWDRVDSHLQRVLRKGDTPEKLTRAFKLILDKDRKDHGGGDGFVEPEVDDFVTDDVQRSVDEGIERAAKRAAAASDDRLHDENDQEIEDQLAEETADDAPATAHSGMGSPAGTEPLAA
ncbi:hypothetical protein BV20DRAFT_969451 [Pilatotrama ljubarskyi]|nr:hypothetical protein BV20DRAFT_969451 [Pilatotrama ljubarskyi]